MASYQGVNLGQLWVQANQAGVADGLRLNQEERTEEAWFKKLQDDTKNAAEVTAAKERLRNADGLDMSSATSKVSGSDSDKASYVMNYMMNKHGYSKDASGAIAGNLMAESAFNTSIEGDKNLGKGRTAFGLAQWREERFTGLQNFAKGKGRAWTDFDTQLDYVAFELKQPGQIKADVVLRDPRASAQAKAIAFDQYYERSDGTHRAKRIANTNTFLQNFNPEVRSLSLKGGGTYGGVDGSAPLRKDAAAAPAPEEPSTRRSFSPGPIFPKGSAAGQKVSSLDEDPMAAYQSAGVDPIETGNIVTSKQAVASLGTDDIFMQGYKAAFDEYATREPLRYTPSDEETA